ncbi:Transposon Tf2-9 polyprotein [Dictyocoela muelleri]|nr:Transposon Tf2-9 polyprotein [Dictyocoela muelleri]
MNRWKLSIQEFDHEIRYIEGKRNKEADLLSRTKVFKINNSRVQITQQLSLGAPIPLIKSYKQQENLRNPPKITITRLLKHIHEKLIHPGYNKMYSTLKRYVDIKNLKGLCREITSRCRKCGNEKNYKKQIVFPNYEFKLREVNDAVSLDIKGPISVKHFNMETQKKNFYILVITDLFSKFSITSILFNITSSEVTKEFEIKWMLKFKAPKCCLTDNGRQFTSENFKKLLEKYEIKHSYTSAYNPKGNSIIERQNREIETVLRMSRSMNESEIIRNMFIRLNMTYNSTIKFSPFEIFFDKPIFYDCKNKLVFDKTKVMENLKQNHVNFVRKSLRNIASKPICIGQRVFLKIFETDKMEPPYTGPYRITEIAKNRSHVFIEKDNKIVRAAIGHIFPLREGEDVECNETLPSTLNHEDSRKNLDKKINL